MRNYLLLCQISHAPRMLEFLDWGANVAEPQERASKKSYILSEIGKSNSPPTVSDTRSMLPNVSHLHVFKLILESWLSTSECQEAACMAVPTFFLYLPAFPHVG